MLTDINLAFNGIGNDGAKALAEALGSGRAVLTDLNLQGNQIGNDGAKALAEALGSGMAVLTDLNLYRNSIGPEGAKALAKALGSGKAVLTKLECVSRRTEPEPRIAGAHAAHPRVRRAAARRTVPVAPAGAPPGVHGASFSAQSARLSEHFFPHLPCFRFFCFRTPPLYSLPGFLAHPHSPLLLLDTSSGRPPLAFSFQTPARLFERTCSPFRALFQTPLQTPARLFFVTPP